MRRRLPALVVVLAAVIAVVVTARDRIDAGQPTFGVAESGWMPVAPGSVGLTET